MKRKKPQIQITIISDDAGIDQALYDIAQQERRIESIKSELNDRIDKLKTEAMTRLIPCQNSVKSIEGGLAVYVEQNKDTLMGKNKSKKFTFGTIGFRKSTELKPLSRWTWKMILETLIDLKKKTAIRIKREVDKERLRDWDSEQLKEIGVRKNTENKFFYETAVEEVTNSAQ